MKLPLSLCTAAGGAALCFLPNVSASAAERAADSKPIALETLVAETVAKNPELKFYEAEIAAAKAGRRTAGSWSNPEFNVNLGKVSARDLDGGKLGDGPVWSVSASQTFEFPGRQGLRKAIANRQTELAELGLEQFRAALAVRARGLGYELMAAQQRAQATREVAQRFQDLLAVLVQRETAGVAPLLEMRIIEASAFTLGHRASEAQVAAQKAQTELSQLRGLSVTAPVVIERQAIPLKSLPGLESLMTTARNQNFEVRTRVAELEQQGLRVSLAKNELWPAVTVSPFYGKQVADNRQTQFGLGVSLPLPLLNRNQGNIEAARARKTQAEVVLHVALRDLERKIAGHRAAYEIYLEQMSKWPGDTADRLREAALKADENYRLGALPVATYTELQKQYLDFLESLLSTQREALEARQQLELLSGTPLFSPSAAPKPAPLTPRK